MTAWTLSARDENRLAGVHPDLVRVVRRAVRDGCPRFVVLEGLRTVARQRQLVAQGASKTMNSRHIRGLAVDIAPLADTDGDGDTEVSWHWPHYRPLAAAIKAAAAAEKVAITWGGDWTRFKDGPHWELPQSTHPDSRHPQKG
jgi:peptidoglycan LD-endopeptidase CwlK